MRPPCRDAVRLTRDLRRPCRLPLTARSACVVLVAGIAVLLADAYSVLTVLIVPRAASSRLTAPMVATRSAFRAAARRARTYDTQDRILALSEPVALIALLTTWLVLAVLGYTLVNWGIGTQTVENAFSEAGSSVFTLGFTLSHAEGSRVVDFVAAGTGMVLVALQIAYLPTLYAAYNRRETLVTLLESRAGSPAWGPELLIRHQLVGTVDNLASLFAEWERWAADVAESHSTYPSLLYLRSPRTRNSWIVSLIAVMDAAALLLAIDPEGAPIEARMCIRMGFTCLRDIALATRIPFDPDPEPDDPVELPGPQFDDARDRLLAAGFTDRPGRWTRPGPTSAAGGSTTRPSAYAVAARFNAPAGDVDRTPVAVPRRVHRARPARRPADPSACRRTPGRSGRDHVPEPRTELVRDQDPDHPGDGGGR